MSLHDFNVSRELARAGTPFTALLLAAFERSDATTFERLRRCFPEVHDEYERRRRSPNGRLVSEQDWAGFEEVRR